MGKRKLSILGREQNEKAGRGPTKKVHKSLKVKKEGKQRIAAGKAALSPAIKGKKRRVEVQTHGSEGSKSGVAEPACALNSGLAAPRNRETKEGSTRASFSYSQGHLSLPVAWTVE